MLRLLEHYTSTQGEGPRVGELTQFVRFAGCNLKCPGWPCDTPYAIQPKLFMKEQQLVGPVDLVQRIRLMYEETGAANICFTGGEPLIQPVPELLEAIRFLNQVPVASKFEIFTNGTQRIDAELAFQCGIVMDWKMPGSGEDPYNNTRITNIETLDTYSGNSVKFVIAQRIDLDVAEEVYRRYLVHADNVEIFIGAAWKQYSDQVIVDFIKERKLPWRLNVQVHNYLYGAQVRGI